MYVCIGMVAVLALMSRGGAGRSDSGFACRLWAGSKEVLSSWPVPRRGLTQQRTVQLKVGVSSTVSFIGVWWKGFRWVIIGVDPHKRMHVASVVEPATNRQVAALQIEASLAGYRRLLRWADRFGERRWAV